MRNLLAVVTITALGTVTWLSIAPQNASACSCVEPHLQLELREVTLVETTRTETDLDDEVDAELLRWPVDATLNDWSLWGGDVYVELEMAQ